MADWRAWMCSTFGQGVAEPLPEQSGAHGGAGAVDGAEERAFGSAGADGAFDFQAAPACGVDGEMIFDDVAAQGADVGQGGFLGFLQIGEESRGGGESGVVVGEAEAGGGGDLPLFAELFLGVMGGELPAGAGGDGEWSRVFDGAWRFRGAGRWGVRERASRRAGGGRFRRGSGLGRPLMATQAPVESSTQARAVR